VSYIRDRRETRAQDILIVIVLLKILIIPKKEKKQTNQTKPFTRLKYLDERNDFFLCFVCYVRHIM
jgi:hypothetical protein